MDRCPRQPCTPSPESLPILAAPRFRSSLKMFHVVARVTRLAALTLALVLATAPSSLAVAPSPGSGCPSPLNTLVITEISVADPLGPRWLELYNPGKQTLSLAKVYLEVSGPASGLIPTDKSYNIGEELPELLAGETVALGWVPAGSATALLKLKVLDLGELFTLPCSGKLVLNGPSGPVDMVAYDVCAKKGGIWGLDPGQTDSCKNDTFATWCAATGDLAGIGSPGKSNSPCDLDSDGYPSISMTGGQADCDDLSKAVFPGATEVCNGKDDDCNGMTDESLFAPPGTCLNKGVCAGPLVDGKPVAKCDGVGGFSCTYPYGYEAVNETLCDGFDNDCDGFTDEGLTNACGSCGAVPAELCNGKDDDCNGKTDDLVALANDCTSTGVCSQAKSSCLGGTRACSFPPSWEVTETKCDGLDNDCDGQTDEEMGIGSPCSKGDGVCAGTGQWQCGAKGDLVCNASQPTKGDTELCGDGLDNNCDGQTDEQFNVGSQCEAGKGVCKVVGKLICAADKLAANCSVKPLAASSAEMCANELDDDCDGQTDESTCQEDDNPGIIDCGAGPRSPHPGAMLLVLALIALVKRRRSCS